MLGKVMHACSSFVELFFGRKFQLHRITGLAFLIQWVAALFLYFYDYEYFYNSILVISLPMTGFAQSIIASCTFTFLPKRQKDPGYYSDKSTLSYAFILENVYFAGLLAFQWLYMHEHYGALISHLWPIEYILVFLPYVTLRPFFPKTSMRDSLNPERENKTDKNRTFYFFATWLTKIFYVFAKHYIGFFLNYARFLDRIPPVYIRHIYLMLIWSCAATTISMFLHTLKFKHYIDGVTSYSWYIVSYMATFYSWIRIFGLFFTAPDVHLLTLMGIGANFSLYGVQVLYQMAVMCLLAVSRGDISAWIALIQQWSAVAGIGMNMNAMNVFDALSNYVPEGVLPLLSSVTLSVGVNNFS